MASKYGLKCKHFREGESDTSKLVKITLSLATAGALLYVGFKYATDPRYLPQKQRINYSQENKSNDYWRQ
jgi:hypothetical protein